jgi:heat shock protein HslJ
MLVAAAVTACGLGSVAGGPRDSGAPAPTADAAPTLNELANATYAGVFDDPVTLADGRWEGTPFAEGGATRPSAGLVDDFVLTGDLNGDGRRETVVLLWESSGGSGTRSYLAVMGRVGGDIRNLGTALVGDRAQVKSGFIADEQIQLELIQPGPGDAACCPTQKALVGWRLIDGRLTRTNTEITGTLSLEDLQGPTWELAEIGWDNPVPAHPRVTIVFDGNRVSGSGGCNGYFGTVTAEASGKLGFSAMGTTMMACPAPAMDLERRYLRTLGGGSTYWFMAGRLVIGCETGDGLVPLIFQRIFDAPSEPESGP